MTSMSDQRPPGNIEAVVVFEKVTKSYGKARGVVDLDLEVRRGELFGYLGPNGAGKTTTIRLMLDLLRPTSGRLRVLSTDPVDFTVRRRIGYLPGELDLYENLTGEYLLTYFDHLRGNGSLGNGRNLSERLDLDLTRPVRDLSRGNKQKVGLVQALMHGPELIILDEPTAGLDPLVQHEVFRILAEAREGGATVFFSSHVLSDVQKLADRVGIIREGRLVAVERLDELAQKALWRFEVTFGRPVPLDEFSSVPNVRDVHIDGDRLICTVVGSVDALVKAIARYEVVNVVSQGSDLEEMFLAHYRGDDLAQ